MRERAAKRGSTTLSTPGGIVSEPIKATTKRMRLRYAGGCQSCHVVVPAGTSATYDQGTKLITCSACVGGSTAPAPTVASEPAVASTEGLDSGRGGRPAAAHAAEGPQIDSGVAGASARREHERRKANREARIRTAHPRIGGLVLAISDDPQSTTAWAVGARGEELLARRLDGLDDQGVLTLHDRRIPGA
jgi:hypothetical protein